MKDKKVLISIVLVALLLIGGGAYAFLGNKPAQNTQPEEEIEEQVEEVKTASAQDFDLDFQVRSDKKAVKFTINNPEGITAVEYELTYTKEVNGEELPEGLIGEAKVDEGSAISIDWRELGTCSAKVCRYDKVVSPVKLTLKITKADGVYQVDDSVAL